MGGGGVGGGIAANSSTLGTLIVVANCTFAGNTAAGGVGGSGGNGGFTKGPGGAGGNGGAAGGGSLALQGVSADLFGGAFVRSSAVSGAGGQGGAGGNGGPQGAAGASPAAVGCCISSAGNTVFLIGTSLIGYSQGAGASSWATGDGTIAGGKVIHGKLAVTTQPPSSVTAGGAFGLTVKVEDASGNVAAGYNGPITLTLASNPSGAVLQGNTTATANAGVAIFTGLSLGAPAVGYVLQANLGSVLATTSSLTVTPAATHLVVTTEPPTTIVAGQPFGLTVKVEDGAGNVATGFNGVVTLSLGTHSGGAALGGGFSMNAVNGVAVFTGLTLNKPGAGYTLQASGNGLPSVSTTAFNATPAAPTHLVITTEPPASTTPGSSFGLVVKAEDASGNVDSSYTGAVFLSLSANPGKDVLHGVTQVTASAGTAVFGGLSLGQPARGYIIRASASGLAPATTTSLLVAGQKIPGNNRG